MTIEVCLYASLASKLPDKTDRNICPMEFPEAVSVRDVLDRLNINEEEPKIIFVNGIHAKLDDRLKEGDRLAVFPPIAGG
ncbi:MAG: MoaD/ThiS family protein [Deltaproteobacteria bacterium]|nr:MoaD/ThiS family protein [Deltaproteobacteria bacterium]